MVSASKVPVSELTTHSKLEYITTSAGFCTLFTGLIFDVIVVGVSIRHQISIYTFWVSCSRQIGAREQALWISIDTKGLNFLTGLTEAPSHTKGAIAAVFSSSLQCSPESDKEWDRKVCKNITLNIRCHFKKEEIFRGPKMWRMIHTDGISTLWQVVVKHWGNVSHIWLNSLLAWLNSTPSPIFCKVSEMFSYYSASFRESQACR